MEWLVRDGRADPVEPAAPVFPSRSSEGRATELFSIQPERTNPRVVLALWQGSLQGFRNELIPCIPYGAVQLSMEWRYFSTCLKSRKRTKAAQIAKLVRVHV